MIQEMFVMSRNYDNRNYQECKSQQKAVHFWISLEQKKGVSTVFMDVRLLCLFSGHHIDADRRFSHEYLWRDQVLGGIDCSFV